MLTAFKNTLKRLSGKIYVFNPVTYFPALLEGLSIELERVRVFKDQVLSATVPNDNMTPDSIPDYNVKYGIPNTLGGTDAQQISRIKEKASLNGFPGPDWLEDQLHMAGFNLYVHENKPLLTNTRQYGLYQYSPSVQYGLTSRFINPDIMLGELVVGSPHHGAGRLFLNMYGSSQYGLPAMYGSPDPNALNPQPVKYARTDDPTLWGYYFVLSPFDDRLAVDESEFLVYTQMEFNYLKNLIIELKLARNWCILQAKSDGL